MLSISILQQDDNTHQELSDDCGDRFECRHHMGWFRVERGRAACTLVLVYVSIKLSESHRVLGQ
jgi:hypothetical protein